MLEFKHKKEARAFAEMFPLVVTSPNNSPQLPFYLAHANSSTYVGTNKLNFRECKIHACFYGTDTSTYIIGDEMGGEDTATVTIDVNPVNDPPVADAGPEITGAVGVQRFLGNEL